MPEAPAPHERRPRIPSRSPQPDDNGNGTSPKRRMPRPGFLAIVVILLGLNWVLLNVLAPPSNRPAVPYSPYFLNQVNDGNVKRISPQGQTITGEFKSSVRYPDAKAEPAKNFTTEIPYFIDGDKLEQTLKDKGVVIDAKPIGDGRGAFLSIILGFGPVLLLVGLFV
jgi:cell division protease FtsH